MDIEASDTNTINHDNMPEASPDDAESLKVADEAVPVKGPEESEEPFVVPDDAGQPYFGEEDPNFEYMYLAVNPENCVVTHCQKYPSFEENGLACNTKQILDAGLYLGETAYRVGKIIRGGRFCTYQ